MPELQEETVFRPNIRLNTRVKNKKSTTSLNIIPSLIILQAPH